MQKVKAKNSVLLIFLILLISDRQQNKRRRISMGCNDSKTETLSHQTINGQTTNNDKKDKFAQRAQNEGFTSQKEELNQMKQKKNPKNIINEGGKSAKVDKIKPEKENVTKITRVKELQSKPEHQKFISDILQKSRGKLAAIVPPTQVTPKGFIKPIVEYSPKKRGDILSQELDYNRSQWERLITENVSQNPNYVILNKSYIAVNQTVKSPYKQKQIERKINKFRKQASNHNKTQATQMQKYEYIESNKTLYL